MSLPPSSLTVEATQLRRETVALLRYLATDIVEHAVYYNCIPSLTARSNQVGEYGHHGDS
jgi:hypothetical protein